MILFQPWRIDRVTTLSLSRLPMCSSNVQRLFMQCGTAFALILCFVLFASPRHINAQTRFSWPDSRFSIESYRYVDVCFVLAKRIEDSIQSRTKDYIDTLHYTQHNITTPLPDELVSATRRCLTHFPPEKIPQQTMSMAQRLYLVAGQDAQAKALIERQLQLIPNDSVRLIVAALDTGINTYLGAQPVRLDAAIDLYSHIERLGSAVPMIDRVRLVMILNAKSQLAYDTVSQAKALNRMVALSKTMTDAEWSSMPGDWITIAILMAVRSIYSDRFRDVLANSTEEFRGLEGTIFKELVGRDYPPLIAENSLGWMMTSNTNIASVPIKGDYWFPAKPEGFTYPRKGVVTLIVPLSADNDSITVDIYLQRAAELRRFKEKWPSLDIIMVVNTAGFFKDIEPPSPETEAVFIDSLFRKFRKMPGLLAVTNTKFWRLPGYDRRRINEITANEEARQGRGGKEDVEIVDKEGKIVAVVSPTHGGASWVELLLSTLVNRPVQAP